MNTKLPKKYYFIPILYVGIICTLLYIQFSGVETFREQIGVFTISGKTESGAEDSSSGVNELHIFCEGIEFPFVSEKPVQIKTLDGLTHKAEIKGYTVTANGIDIIFTKEFLLKFISDKEDSNKISIQPVSNSYNSIKSVYIPFATQETIWTEIPGLIPVLSIIESDRRDEIAFLSLPVGSLIDNDNNMLVLVSNGYDFKEIVLEKAPEGITDPVYYWFSKNDSLIDKATYKNNLALFIRKAFSGWENTRYKNDSSAWTIQGENDEFKESILNALFSESIGTDSYSRISNKLKAAGLIHKKDLTFISNLYEGDIINTTNIFLKDSSFQIQRLKTLTDSSNPDVFKETDLPHFIVDLGLNHSIKKIGQIAESIDILKQDIPACLCMLNTYIQASVNYPELEESFKTFKSILEKRILPSIVITDEGMFLKTSDESSDIFLSIIAGSLLIKTGIFNNNEVIESIGRTLIVSSLNLADVQSIMPAAVFIKDNSIIKTEGFLPPENVYQYISKSGYLPKNISLYKEIAMGSWIRTIAPEMQTKITPSEYRFKFTFPAGEIHNIILFGIKPFQTLKMLGINWKSDPYFQSYFSGWYYDAENEILYIKLRHREKQEEIVISYINTNKSEEAESSDNSQ